MSRTRDLAAVVVMAALALGSQACGTGPQPQAGRTPSSPRLETFKPAPHPGGRLQILRNGLRVAIFKVEIARTPEQQATGLMGRRRLSADAGMVFLHDAPSENAFYMKNTLIPLDLAFWDADRKLFQIVQMQPCRKDPCPLHPPERPYLGALEVNQGALGRNGVMVGDDVVLSAIVAGG